MIETYALRSLVGAVASINQPSIEGQHGHRATQRQKISGVVRLEADGLFGRRDNQAHNNHVGQIVVQALEALRLLHYSSRPSRRGSMSNLLICSWSDHRISGLTCDTK